MNAGREIRVCDASKETLERAAGTKFNDGDLSLAKLAHPHAGDMRLARGRERLGRCRRRSLETARKPECFAVHAEYLFDRGANAVITAHANSNHA